MLESVCECVLVPSCTCTCSKQPRSAEVVDVEGGQERLLRRLVDSRAAQGEVTVTYPLKWSFQTEIGILCWGAPYRSFQLLRGPFACKLKNKAALPASLFSSTFTFIFLVFYSHCARHAIASPSVISSTALTITYCLEALQELLTSRLFLMSCFRFEATAYHAGVFPNAWLE